MTASDNLLDYLNNININGEYKMTKYVVIANLTIADQTKLGFEVKSKFVSNYLDVSTHDNPNKPLIALYAKSPKLFDDIASADAFAKRLRRYRYDGQQITVAWFEAVEYTGLLTVDQIAEALEETV